MPLVADLVFAFGPICLLDDPSTPRLWVWVRRVLERLVAPSVRQEPAWLVRSRTGATEAVVWLEQVQREWDTARKGGRR